MDNCKYAIYFIEKRHRIINSPHHTHALSLCSWANRFNLIFPRGFANGTHIWLNEALICRCVTYCVLFWSKRSIFKMKKEYNRPQKPYSTNCNTHTEVQRAMHLIYIKMIRHRGSASHPICVCEWAVCVWGIAITWLGFLMACH